ncbi:MAG: hypothetical protein ACLVJ6_17550 [Merdibacter sp.]
MDKLQRDEFYNYRFLSNLTVSPEKTAAAVTVWQADPKNNSYTSNIWVRKDQGFAQLTAMDKESSFIFDDETTIRLWPAVTARTRRRRKPASRIPRITDFVNRRRSGHVFTVPLKAIDLEADADLYLIKARTDAGIGDFAAMSEEQREQVLCQRKTTSIMKLSMKFRSGPTARTTNKLRNTLYVVDAKAKTCTPITAPLFMTGDVDEGGKVPYRRGIHKPSSARLPFICMT